ncbi:hypothetical protein GJAV_G00072160 [Gymnothorax javanicus]|nr:hypothetical protein GJAV_G00072160 [Gymnothorax javanicus]
MAETAEIPAAIAGAAFTGGSLLSDIIQKAILAGQRTASIHLTNNCKSNFLINPRVYTHSGYSYNPPQPTVKKERTEVLTFGHTKGSARGAVGVLTYDITADRKTEAVKRLAVMFSVPFDYASNENLFALGLFDVNQPCDKSLYDLMYYRSGPFTRQNASGSEIRYQGQNYTLVGTMCPAANAVIKMELWDSGN